MRMFMSSFLQLRRLKDKTFLSIRYQIYRVFSKYSLKAQNQEMTVFCKIKITMFSCHFTLF